MEQEELAIIREAVEATLDILKELRGKTSQTKDVKQMINELTPEGRLALAAKLGWQNLAIVMTQEERHA